MEEDTRFFKELEGSFTEWISNQKKAMEDLRTQHKIEIETLKKEIELLKVKGLKPIPKIIDLNVGGKKFSTSVSTLTKYPDSMLGIMFSGRHEVHYREDGSVFIDRDPKHFRLILNYLRDGKVNLSDQTILEELRTEAVYYQLEELVKQIDLKNKVDQARPKQLVKSSRIQISGQNLLTNGTGDWATVRWIGSDANTKVYYEIQVVRHLGSGHIRVGLAGNNHSMEGYLGQDKNSVAMYPGNQFQGFGIPPQQPPNQNWNTGDRIGMFFDKVNKSLTYFYNSTRVITIANIPQDFEPALTVHCTHDELTLVKNPTLPAEVKQIGDVAILDSF